MTLIFKFFIFNLQNATIIKKKSQRKNDYNNRLTLHLLRHTDFHRFASASLRTIKTPEESVIEKKKLKISL